MNDVINWCVQNWKRVFEAVEMWVVGWCGGREPLEEESNAEGCIVPSSMMVCPITGLKQWNKLSMDWKHRNHEPKSFFLYLFSSHIFATEMKSLNGCAQSNKHSSFWS